MRLLPPLYPRNAALVITTASLPSGTRGSSYSTTVQGSGGTTPYSWSSSGLPSGLGITASTGAITGTPSTNGTFSPTIYLTDANNRQVSKQFSLTINVPTLRITTSSLPAATTSTSYSATVAATGGVTPYTWSATGLPSGFGIGSTTGTISGSSSSASSQTITVTCTDSLGTTASKNFTFTVSAPAPTPIYITTASLPSGTLGSSYSTTMTAAAGSGTRTWSQSGLPSGLGINSSSGLISGTPTSYGSFSVTVSVSDSTGSDTETYTLTIAVPALTITTSSLGTGVVSSGYSLTATGSGGTGTGYSWSATGLPSGLSIASGTGLISGSPGASGSYSVTLKLRDSRGASSEVSKTLTLTVNAALTITTSSLTSGTQGTAYSLTATGSGGTGTGYSWSATGLPAGLSISTGGVISGTPTASGSSTVVLKLQDSRGASYAVTKSLTLSIAASYTYITTEACLTNVGIKRVDASSYSIGTGTLLFEDTANTLQTINLNIGLYGVAVYNAGPVLSQYAIIHATSAVAVKTVRTSVAAGQIQQGGLAVGDETCPIVGASASSDAYDAFLIRIWQIV